MRYLSQTLFFGLAALVLLTPASAPAQWGAGQCLAPGLSPSDALESCRDALNIDPTHPEVHYKIGWALSEMGAHLEAVDSYREAIRNQPDYAKAHLGLGKALEKLGRYAEALAAYREALRLKPEDAAARKQIENLSARVQEQRKKEPSRVLAAGKEELRAEERRKKAALLAKRKAERERQTASERRKAGESRAEKQARLAPGKSREKKRGGEGVRFRFAPGKVNKDAVAVIIGNRNYSPYSKDIPDVTYAHNDAGAVYAYVTKALGYRPGNIIRLEDATQAQLISTFGTKDNPRGKLRNWVRSGKSDVFIFYSGHGVPGLSDGRSYLLPVDADPATPELNGYPLQTLYANLGKLPARSVTVMIDACFSGRSAGGAVIRSTSSIGIVARNPAPAPPKAVVLTAAGPDQVASWDHEAKLGLFTRYILEGLSGAADRRDAFGDGDGKVTLAELGEFLNEEMTYQARRRFGRVQTPQWSGDSGKVLSTLR